MTLTVFQAGNSRAVSIPKALADKLGFEVGVKVEPYLVDHSIAYRPVVSPAKNITEEFDSWLNKTAKKYAPALKALAQK